jgi:hypothetical protein
MNHKALVAIIWLGLFVATVVFRHLIHSSERPGKDARQLTFETVDLLTQTKFDSIPARSGGLGVVTGDAVLSSYIAANKDQILRCRDMILRRTGRPRELFELSFNLLRSSSPDGSTHSQPTDVRLEKSSASLLPEERKCLVETFAAYRFNEDTVSFGRVYFPLCLKIARSS